MLADAAVHRVVITIEDGFRTGGIGTSITSALTELAGTAAPTVINLGVPDAYIQQAKPDTILARFGLDGPGVATAVKTALAATPA
jgi:1-deoxy-D-xylulose-5-phosphate synthase